MQNVNFVPFERIGMGNESEQLTLKAMFYREHRSFAPSLIVISPCLVRLSWQSMHVV